jgi:hypothetical protein
MPDTQNTELKTDTNNVTPPPSTPEIEFPDVSKLLTKEDLKAFAEDVRKQEKSKLYSKIEAQEAELKEIREYQEGLKKKEQQQLEAKKKAEEAKKAAAEKERQKSLTTKQQMEEQAAQLKAVREQLAIVSEEGDRRLNAFKVEAHKQRRLRESNISLDAFVSGSTIEEVETSIANLKTIEDTIREDERKKAEAQLREQLKGQLPTPPQFINSDDGDNPLKGMSLRDAAKLPDDQFALLRKKLMDRIKGQSR